jgi:hypothetical protein
MPAAVTRVRPRRVPLAVKVLGTLCVFLSLALVLRLTGAARDLRHAVGLSLGDGALGPGRSDAEYQWVFGGSPRAASILRAAQGEVPSVEHLLHLHSSARWLQ